MSNYNYSNSHQHQYSNQSHSASSSSNSSPMQRTQSNNSGSDNSSTPIEHRNNNLGFLEDFVHNNNYPGPSAQTMSQLFSNVASPNDFLPTNFNSRENRRTTFQQLPSLSLSGASDGTSLYKGLNNAFDWNDGTSNLAQSNRGSSSHGHGQLPLPPTQSNREWQHPSNSSFSPDDVNNSGSNGWSNNYQRAQMEQQQQNWQASLNHQSLISSRQAQAEEEAIMAQAEEISKQFNSTASKVQAQSSQNVKSEDRIFKPATSDSTKKPRAARSTKPSTSSQTVKKEEVEEEDVKQPSLSESSSKVTNARKRKFTPATAPAAVETEVEDSSSRSGGRSRYPCLHAGCGKTFSTSGHRARHHRIHTGIKPYRCTFPDCGACFSRQDNGLQHFRTHKASSKSTDQDEVNDGGMSDSSRAHMVETALEQGTAIEVVKGNQESRVEKRSQTNVSPVKSTSKSRKTAHAPVPTSTSSKPTKAESSNASSRSSKRVKMEKTPSLDPSTESSASEASSSSSSGSRSTPHMRTTRRNVRALQQKEGELPMLSVSLSSPSYTNPSSNGFSSSNGSSLSNGSSSSASTNASSTVVSPVFQQQDQREKQLQYSDSLRQQMMMMPMYGNGSIKDGSSNDFITPRTSIDSRNGSMEGKVSAYDGMTPGTQDAARQTSFSDAFRGAFPQVDTPDIIRQQ